jgi:hypothetical protein
MERWCQALGLGDLIIIIRFRRCFSVPNRMTRNSSNWNQLQGSNIWKWEVEFFQDNSDINIS